MKNFFHKLKKFQRYIVLIIFIIADIYLGIFWLHQQNRQTLIQIKQVLEKIHPQLSQTLLGTQLSQSIPNQQMTTAELPENDILTILNKERFERKLPELEQEAILNEGAQKVVFATIEQNYDLVKTDSSKVLTNFFKQKKVENITILHDTLIGPVTIRQLELYWQTDSEHAKTIASPEITKVGIATGTATISGQIQGITVLIYSKPQQVIQSSAPISKAQNTKQVVFPNISNTSIIEALNSYRATHNIHQLVEQQNLCEYAQKRVDDLIAYGGLDGHEGFKKDFENAESLPESIKNYPGGAVGENLAYQNCKNMTTGDSFIAQNATALIEWCFDSSTKGHREAQLNPRYNNVCARNKNGYFVIIFGE